MAKSTNNRSGTVFLTVLIVLAVAVVTILIFRGIYINNQPPASDDDSTSTVTDSATDQPAEEAPDDDTATQSSDTPSVDTPLQYEGSDPNTSATIAAVLTYYGVQNGEYLVNVNIPQYLSGTCQITLGSYTGSVAIDQSAASSACSFHIPVDQLQSGLQPLKVNIKSSAASGVVEETIDVNL